MPGPIAAGIALRLMGSAVEGIGEDVAAAAAEFTAERLRDPFGRFIGGENLANRTDITVPVESSAIRAIGYNTAGIITVVFRRGGDLTYYFPGTEDEFLAFLLAPSKGQFFNDHYK